MVRPEGGRVRARTGEVSRLVLVLLATAALSACAKHEFEPPDQEARLADAEARFTEVVWDTITWESAGQRELEGNGVFAAKCRNCHGPLGRGGTEYAESRGLEVPSLVEPGWSMAGQPDSVRHRVFVGHVTGMPTWGVAGITPREIDAVSYYLLQELRPEVLGGDG
jgi:mono/diheme cytochrome c family protein